MEQKVMSSNSGRIHRNIPIFNFWHWFLEYNILLFQMSCKNNSEWDFQNESSSFGIKLKSHIFDARYTYIKN